MRGDEVISPPPLLFPFSLSLPTHAVLSFGLEIHVLVSYTSLIVVSLLTMLWDMGESTVIMLVIRVLGSCSGPPCIMTQVQGSGVIAWLSWSESSITRLITREGLQPQSLGLTGRRVV